MLLETRPRIVLCSVWRMAHRPAPRPATPTESGRFWSYVQKTGGCWFWTGAKFKSGYGAFSYRYKTVRAHRLAYELLVGEIKMGYELDHVCHNDDPSCPGGRTCKHRGCVNPAHLRPVLPEDHPHPARQRRATPAP